jgi:hypothetical protein
MPVTADFRKCFRRSASTAAIILERTAKIPKTFRPCNFRYPQCMISFDSQHSFMTQLRKSFFQIFEAEEWGFGLAES